MARPSAMQESAGRCRDRIPVRGTPQTASISAVPGLISPLTPCLPVLRHLQVVWCRALPNASRDVVVGSVAGAEPAVVVTSTGNGHTAQVCAHTNDHKVLHTTKQASPWVTKLELAHTACTGWEVSPCMLQRAQGNQ